MKSKLTHIFFDLDHTIWDFDKNAEETLYELYDKHSLRELGCSDVDFIATYTRNNHALWAEYHLGNISKEYLRTNRFRQTFLDLGLQDHLIPAGFEEEYVRVCPTKTNLIPRAHETLGYLKEKYHLHLITNGFKESTEIKVRNTGLGEYFKSVIISEDVGVNKPDPGIFEFALGVANGCRDESIMIGDSLEADIRGALSFGMEAIYFNPLQKEKPADVPRQIYCLGELIDLL